MAELALAAAFFAAIHLLVAGTRIRGWLAARLGERIYLGVFSLASLAGIVWLASAYARAGHVSLWGQLYGLRPLVLALMLVAVLLAVLGLTTPNPTAVGGERLLATGRPARGVLTVTRHPFLWGIVVWAVAHLAINGDLAALLLFGSLLLVAAAGTRSIDAKRTRAHPEPYAAFRAVTSNVPFAAVAAGRTRLDWAGIGWWRPVLAVAVYLALALAHPWLFGVPAVVHGA